MGKLTIPGWTLTRIYCNNMNKGLKTTFLTALLILAIVLSGSNISAEVLKRTSVQVKNITCESCLTLIGSKLRGLRGTVGMKADLKQGLVVVDHKPLLDGKKIARAISVLGYPAEIISSTDIDEESALIFPEVDRSAYGRCRCNGIGRSGYCGGSASSWKRLYRIYFGDEKKADRE